MKAIVAVDRNWGIGRDGGLLVHLPGDLKYFKEKTLGKTVVMGRETLESLPGGKPLPGRDNIVLTRNSCYEAGCPLCHSEEDLLNRPDCRGEDVFVIGGEQVYRMLLPYCDTCYVTKIHGEYPAEKFFPDLDQSEEFEVVWESEPVEEKGVTYHFVEYRRKQGADPGAEPGDGGSEK